MLLMIAIAAFCVLADIGTKNFAYQVLRIEEIPVIRDVLYLTYVENRGAAFGILQNQRWIFIIVTVAVMLTMLTYVIWKKPQHKMLLTSFGLIVGGGIGNLIDRIVLTYVIDFIDFRLIHFPVFNIADICVVCGSVLLCIYVLFFDGKCEKNGSIDPQSRI